MVMLQGGNHGLRTVGTKRVVGRNRHLTGRRVAEAADGNEQRAQPGDSAFGWTAETSASTPPAAPQADVDVYSNTESTGHLQTSTPTTPEPGERPARREFKTPFRSSAQHQSTHLFADSSDGSQYDARQFWPGHARSGKDPVYNRITHLAIIAIAIAMVLGGGFWSRDQDQSSVLPGGTDNIQFVSSAPFTEAEVEREPVPNTQEIVGSSENVMGGYLTTDSLSVTPQQLGVETYVTSQGQTISSVAIDTGLSEETLLWANDYRDPDQTLPAGTQLRLPPTDGMLHLVTEADTIENIAERYSVSPDAITSYEPNGLEHSADLVPNRYIMVPGGSMPTRNEVIYYTVREGDQLWQIAERFGLRAQTLLWTNSLSSSEHIEPGQRLAILPTDGVMVGVGPDDTVESLAEEYGVSPAAIRDWPANGLGENGTLMVGQSVMIPGGTPPNEPEPEPEPEPAPEPQDTDDVMVADDEEPTDDVFSEPVGGSPPETSEPSGASPYGSGEFVMPTTGAITQYFHSAHNGWDIANRIGTDIWAADNGRVIFSGWNEHGLGYAVAIDHGNGYQTWYGHMDEQPPVEVGQTVEQGEYIGPMGSTGFSTGPHVHFVIAYNGVYQDPGNYLR